MVSKRLKNLLRNIGIAAAFTLALWLIALSQGWGFQISGAKAERIVISGPVFVHQEVVVAHVNVSLNPVLFPFNYISGGQTLTGDFVGYVPLHHWQPPSPSTSGGANLDRESNRADFGEIAQIMAAGEVWKNLPLYFSVGFVVAYAVGTLIERLAEDRNREASVDSWSG